MCVCCWFNSSALCALLLRMFRFACGCAMTSRLPTTQNSSGEPNEEKNRKSTLMLLHWTGFFNTLHIDIIILCHIKRWPLLRLLYCEHRNIWISFFLRIQLTNVKSPIFGGSQNKRWINLKLFVALKRRFGAFFACLIFSYLFFRRWTYNRFIFS